MFSFLKIGSISTFSHLSGIQCDQQVFKMSRNIFWYYYSSPLSKGGIGKNTVHTVFE